MKKRQLIFILVLLGLLGALYAQDDPPPVDYTDETAILIEEAEQPDIQTPPGAALSAWDVVRMILILGAVLGFIYLIFRLLKRAGGPKFENSDLINMHATLGVGGGRTLHLVEVGREFFLVGSAENSVNLVAKIEDKESIDQIRFNLTTEKPEQPRNFADVLSRLFQKGGGQGDLNRSLGQNRDFMKAQRDRLKNL